ncbi:MAG: GNAT family N-acetyltransferase [Deltaproteobacteria bacterium]|nr:GNAT family N-acetyltransferase [Deltaproteobacteria bacterium]
MKLELLAPDDPKVGAIWRGLAPAAPSYFQTWGWIETWLACLPPAIAPSLAVLFDGDAPIAASFLGRPRRFVHRLVPSRTRFLNVTGVARYDELTIEYNAILTAPGRAVSLAAWLAHLPRDWDELVLPALSRAAFPGDSLDQALPDHRITIDREVGSPYVDLARVRAHQDGYLGLVHATTRAQIRRAERGFGPITIEIATEAPHALAIYDELIALHAAGWHARGQAGAFADPWFARFHRLLITARLAHGEIQLVRVHAAGATIGCLYNFVSGGRVQFYQAGFAPQPDPRCKAGYVCHAEAVRHNAAAGHAIYDFLGGDQVYKHHLATDLAHLVWARIARPLTRLALDDQLHHWVHATRAWWRRRGPTPARP